MSVRVLAAALSLGLVACGDDGEPATDTVAAPLTSPITATDPFGAIPGEAGVDGAGNATYRIPIEIPPGIAGMQPDLALEYSSGGRDGTVGAGWQVTGLSAIYACRATLARDGYVAAPRGIYDAVDPEVPAASPLCLDGDRLELESGTAGKAGAVYRPHHDPTTRVVLDSFTHFFPGGEGLGGGEKAVATFTAYGRDGRVWTYGAHIDANSSSVRLNNSVAYVWYLEQVTDRFGNAWRVKYDAVVEEIHTWSLPYIVDTTTEMMVKEIDYTDAHPADDDESIMPGNRKVVFEYELRPAGDQYTSWGGGVVEKVRRRLSEIRTEVAGTVVRHYYLGYANGSHSGRSALRTVTECDDFHACLPPTTFDTELGSPAMSEAGWPGVDPTQANELDLATIDRMVKLDYDDDGHDELLYTDGASPWNGAATWHLWDPDRPATVPIALPAAGIYDSNPALAPSALDVTGDGATDILVPVAEGCDFCRDQSIEGMSIGYATELVLQVIGVNTIAPVVVDDGSDDKIFIMAAGDFNGDTLGDAWLCRGADARHASWVLAMNRTLGSQGFQYELIPSDRPCTAFEWYEVLDQDDDGADELLVLTPARDPGADPDYEDENEYGGHLGVLNYGFGQHVQWGAYPSTGAVYQVIDWDDVGRTTSMRASGLPLDINQRIQRDACHPDAELPGAPGPGGTPGPTVPIERVWPFMFTGPGPDKFGDVNGDGLEDVIRLEHVPETANPDDEDYQVWSGEPDYTFNCRADDLMNFEVRVWLNTGHGFDLDPGVAERFMAIKPWDAMRRFEMMTVVDRDEDGRADVIGPDFAGDGSSWMAHLARPGAAGGYVHQGVELEAVWNTAHVWDWQGDPTVRMIPIRAESSASSPGLLVMTGEDGGAHPTAWESDAGVPDHIWQITNGLGEQTRFVYTVGSDRAVHTTSSSRAAAAARDGLVVKTMLRDLALPGAYTGVREATDYLYTGGRRDRQGSGWLGFDRVLATAHVVGNPGGVDPTAFRTVETWFDPSISDVFHDAPRAGRPIDEVVTWHLDADRDFVRWTHDDYDVRPVLAGAVYGTYPSADRVREYDDPYCVGRCGPSDLGPDLTAKDLTTSSTWDDYGNELSQGSTTPTSSITTTTHWMTPDLTNWLVARPDLIISRSKDLAGVEKTRTTMLLYDPGAPLPRQKLTEPLGTQDTFLHTDYTRDARGMITSEVTGNQDGTEIRTTGYDWGDGYYLHSITNPKSQVEHYTYDAGLGVRTDVQDVASVHHVHKFDRLGRPSGALRVAGVMSDGADVTITRLGPGAAPGSVMRVREHSDNGAEITRELDRLGREIHADWRGFGWSDAGPQKTVFQDTGYDVHGNVRTVTAPQWSGLLPVAVSMRTWDAAGRLVIDTEPTDTGHTADTTWEYTWHNVKRTDPDLRTTTYTLDDRGDVVEILDGISAKTCIDHGAFALVEQVTRNCKRGTTNTDPMPVTKYARDPYGRVTQTDDTALGIRKAKYDAFGQRIATIDAYDTQTTYAYDHLGRHTSRTAPGAVTTWTWDTSWTGQLGSSASPDGVTKSYAYDGYGRLIQLDTVLAGEHHAFAVGYDTHDRVQKLTYPTHPTYGTFRVRYIYDAAGYLAQVDDDINLTNIWKAIDATPFGSLRKETFPNATDVTWTRDPGSDRVLGIKSAGFQNDTFAWTAAGDLHERDDLTNAMTEVLGYDGLHRLTSSTIGVASYPVTYDRVGNIKTKNGSAYTYFSNTRLKTAQGQAFVWNNNGDPDSYNGHLFAMTPSGKVRSIDGAALTLDYDADDERVRRTSPGAITLSLDDLYERTTTGGVVTQRFLVRAGGRVVAEADRVKNPLLTTTWRYFHPDHLGSPRAVSDKLGAAVRLSFDAWGRRRDPASWSNYAFPATPAVVGFTGHQLVPDIDFVDMGARLYDPKIGRFVTPDPVVGNGLDGQAYNPYAYVRNNPLSRRDPTGLTQTDGPDPDGRGDDDGDDGGTSGGSNDCKYNGCENRPGDDGEPPGLPPTGPSTEGGGPEGGEGGPTLEQSVTGVWERLSGVLESAAARAILYLTGELPTSDRAAYCSTMDRIPSFIKVEVPELEAERELVDIEEFFEMPEKPEGEEHDVEGNEGEPLHFSFAPRAPYGSVVPVPSRPMNDRIVRSPQGARAAPGLGRTITPSSIVIAGGVIEADNRGLDLHGRHGLDDYLEATLWKGGE